jgi:YegS/Rv2252/BmrU family lipid kinase
VSTTACVIVNGTAGGLKGDESRQTLKQQIEKSGFECGLVFADQGSNVAELARDAIRRGAKVIVAGGGDGTISAVASALVGTDSVLGVLPLGTLNHFAKDAGIPSDVEAAVQTLLRGKVVAVDVGEVNGRVFVNNSGLGLYPALVSQRERQQRQGATKRTASLWAALQVFREFRLLRIRLLTEQQQLRRTTTMVFVGNNQYEMEGFRIGTRSRLDAGELCLYMPHHMGRLQLLWLSATAIFGHLNKKHAFDVVHAQEFLIETGRRQLRVTLDGEVTWMTTPLHYRIRPKALHLIVAEAEVAQVKE